MVPPTGHHTLPHLTPPCSSPPLTPTPRQVFLVAAEALSSMACPDELAHGQLFPPFSHIRQVSAKLMAAVAAYIVDAGLGTTPLGFEGDWEATCQAAMWDV